MKEKKYYYQNINIKNEPTHHLTKNLKIIKPYKNIIIHKKKANIIIPNNNF